MSGLTMESTEQSTGSSFIVAPSQAKQSDADDEYEDDFEEMDAFIKEKSSESTSNMGSDFESSSQKQEQLERGHIQSDADYPEEKGQRESSGQIPMEKDKQGPLSYDDALSDDSEPEAEGEGEVIFTDDQQRAMMELMTQKHCSGDYTGDPPEYNVRERLKELNKELAREPEPEPNSRQTRVGFKEELVDFVAPSPQISDDDDDDDADDNHADDGGCDKGATTTKPPPDEKDVVSEKGSSSADDLEDRKQYVVERDGKFEILEGTELSAVERALLDVPNDDDDDNDKHDEGTDDRGEDSNNAGRGEKNTYNEEKPSEGQQEQQEQEQGSSKAHNDHLVPHQENLPQPPSRPRPNTVNGHCRNRSVQGAHSPSPRSHSVSSSIRSHNSKNSGGVGLVRVSAVQSLSAAGVAHHGDCNYNSPYALSASEKERARERARLRKHQKEEEERLQREEEECRRKESKDAFKAWLQHKADHDRRKKMEEEERRRKMSADKDDVKSISSEAKENDEAFRSWLKQKQTQQKREKLLKKREQQSVKDSYYVRSREECDLAYREWLKKKYTEFRQQKAVERERQKSFSIMARKARKQQMMTRSLIAASNFRAFDPYDYRF